MSELRTELAKLLSGLYPRPYDPRNEDDDLEAADRILALPAIAKALERRGEVVELGFEDGVAQIKRKLGRSMKVRDGE